MVSLINTAEKYTCFWIKEEYLLEIDTLANGRKNSPKYSRFSSAVWNKIEQDKIYVATNQCFGIEIGRLV